MATYYDNLIKAVEEQQKKYKDAQRQIAKNQKDIVASAYKKAETTIRENIDAQKNEAQTALADTLDYNALSEAVARRNAKESLANAGITNSGISETNQTAISVMRGNADAKARNSLQTQINSLSLALDQYLAENEQEKAAKIADIDIKTQQTVADNEQQLFAAAKKQYGDFISDLSTVGKEETVQQKADYANKLYANGMISKEEYDTVLFSLGVDPDLGSGDGTDQGIEDVKTPGTLMYAQNQVGRVKRSANATTESVSRAILNFADDLTLEDMLTLIKGSGVLGNDTSRKKFKDAVSNLFLATEDVAVANKLLNIFYEI